MSNQNHLQRAVEFLNAVGLPTRWSPGASGFIEGVRIVHGELYVDPDCPVSGVLHEAGHLACVPGQYRNLMSDHLAAGVRTMLDDVMQMELHPDHPLSRAVIGCGDGEATALAWAYGIHLGIPPELIIMDEEYGGEGAIIRDRLALNRYAGINGLQHAGGFTRGSDRYTWIKLPTFPALGQWLQPAISPDPVPGLYF